MILENEGYQYAALDLVTVVTAMVTAISLCRYVIYSTVTRVTTFSHMSTRARARAHVRYVFSGNSGNFVYKNIFIWTQSLKSAVTIAVTRSLPRYHFSLERLPKKRYFHES